MIKKITAVIVSVFIMFSMFAVVSVSGAEVYGTGTYLVTSANGLKLYDNYEASVDFNTVARKGAYITVIKVAGKYGYTVYDSIYGWVDLSLGSEYIKEMPSITASGKVDGVKAIEITSLPDKLTYVEGEEAADIDGLSVSVIFNDVNETRMNVTGYSVVFPNLYSFGKKAVKVYYSGYSASFDINIVKVPVTGIVLTLPEKTSYIEGEAISLSGMTVTAYFSDGRNGGQGVVLSPDEYTVSGITPGITSLAPGTYTVTVTYKYPEISSSFHIYVSGKAVTTLKFTKVPPNPSLYQGQTFNKSDFALSATYDNGETENITEFDIEYDNMLIGTHTARIYYMGKYVAFDYSVFELLENGIEPANTENVGNYVGADIDFSKLQVYIVYNSGEKKLTDAYTLEYDIDSNTIGKYPVTVKYGDFSASFDYTVAQRPIIAIGDVNLDGKITAADARMALRLAAELETLSDEARAAADTDSDGKCTAKDARKILRVASGLDKF